jgi:hypothetical protein
MPMGTLRDSPVPTSEGKDGARKEGVVDGKKAANANVHTVLGIDGAMQGEMSSRGVMQYNVLHESRSTGPIGERNAGQ